MNLETRASAEFRDLANLVRWLKISLAALAVISLFSAYSSSLQLTLLNQAQSGALISKELADANDTREGLVAVIGVVSYLVTAILFLRWTYLVKRNVLALGGTNQAFSPGWSVGYYFIPILTLWMPYQALREAFEASHPDAQYNSNTPSRPALMPLWWTLWLVACAVGNASLRASLHSQTISELRTATSIAIADSLIKLPLIAVVWLLISTMLYWQSAKSEALGATRQYSGVPGESA